MVDENVVTEETVAVEVTPDDGQVAGLKSRLVEKEAQLAQMTKRLSEMDRNAIELERRMAQTVSGYRAMMVKANPGVPEELLSGQTIEELSNSLEKAKAIVERVKQGLAAEKKTIRVPAGAPERGSAHLEALSPREKIQFAVGGKK